MRILNAGWLPVLGVTVILGCMGTDQGPASSDLRLIPVARFGSVDGSLALQRVTRLSLSPGRSRLYVTQWPVPSLLMLSREGDSLGVIGRGGSGPGEFSGPPGPVWKGDTLWVPDADYTVVLYDSLGTFIRQDLVRVPPLGPFQSAPWPIAPLGAGAILFKGSAGLSRVISGRVTELPFVRVESGGVVSDTVVQVAVAGSAMRVILPGGGLIIGLNPWGTAPKWTVLPDSRGLLIADPRDFSATNPVFRLSLVNMTGDTLLSGLVATEPVPIDEERIEILVKELFSYRLENGQSTLAGMTRTVQEQVGFPPIHPPVASILGSEDGSIWLTGPHPSADSIRVTVLDGSDLTVIGSTALPRNVELLWVSMTEVWATARGRWEESYILRFEPRWE